MLRYYLMFSHLGITYHLPFYRWVLTYFKFVCSLTFFFAILHTRGYKEYFFYLFFFLLYVY
jgi:hypothetical protein